MPRDFYSDLGVGKTASAEEIKEAYKRLAKQFHPDVSKEKDAEEKFKRISEAYRVLSDPQKRAQFDQFGENAERFGGAGQGFGGAGGFQDFSGQDFDFSDLFENMGFGGSFSDFFGGGASGQRRGPARGQDMLAQMEVTFEESVFGTEKEVFVNKTEKCSSCHGQKTTEKDGKQTCSTCKGSGAQKTVRRTVLGTIATQTTCGKCRGTGTIISKPCKKCNGTGVENVRKKISIKIPGGIENGTRMRVHGEGNASANGGESGDLFIEVFVKPHKFFKRDQNDIYIELPVTFSEAALGAEIDVPTVHGKVGLKIPSGTQSGTIFNLKGKGVKGLRSTHQGNQFVKVSVYTPTQVSKKQKELFEHLKKEEGKDPRKELFG